MKVSSDILRVYKALHTWVGIGTGLLLFIGFFAGALTMFKQPLDRWSAPPAQQLAMVKSNELDTLVSGVMQQFPDARQQLVVHLESAEHISAPVEWQSQDEDGGHGPDLDGEHWHATLNAAGEVQAESIRPSMLGDLIDLLHQTAGIPGTVGHEYLGVQILGLAGILYFLALVSGLIILLPTLVKDFFLIRRGKNRKRFWLDAHNVIGITSLPFHLIIAFTVVVFAFHDSFYGSLKAVVYQDTPMFGAPPAAGERPQARSVDQLLPPTELIRRIEQAAPDFKVTELVYMQVESPRPIVRAGIYNPQYLVRGPLTGYVGINPYNGELTMTGMLPGKSNVWSDIVVTFFALHFGSFAGEWVRWVYFLLGLSGAFLFYSGNLLWIESRRKKQKRGQPLPQQARNTRLMAALTIGVSLGSVAGIGFAIAAGKWGHVAAVADINSLYLQVYYLVFLLALTFAFMRGGARAAVPLLWLCALASALIPVTSALAVLMPSTGLWFYNSAATLAVDFTALLLALAFIFAAYRTQRGLQRANADTVWYIEETGHKAEPAGIGAGS
ncbi:PepSY-associated TM helix domain-containing protein [Thalassolituus alkanivorans]|uniref:PepSY-associated TM helix domain-containing protein n=1 Tax=Thalassolituus alkanivorans TaxID=2881055 RepID=UPI001E585F4D|nr:PepSY-associated TM helix domain-containing protein [Thalassolituus alkanivorans]MCB2388689.1 PepSY domain-containing protein [Thalassolituus alkanivorans]MCB2423592.1 PepSY domain-containing protein [Thalassolituus alkanivorans]